MKYLMKIYCSAMEKAYDGMDHTQSLRDEEEG